MNRKQLTDSLLKNWPAKVICFVIAFFLYIFYQSSLIDKKTFVIPLNVQENGIVIHVGNIPASIVVSIRANENDVKSIFASDMVASINLDNIVNSGTYDVPVEVVISDKLKEIDPLEIRLKEENLSVSVEKKISRFVPIKPSVVGEVDSDYEIKDIIIEPSTIEIKGPESIVNAINELSTGRVNVSNAITNFSVETDVKQISNLVEIKDSENVKATVVVAPKLGEYEFSNIPIKIMNLNSNFEIVENIPTVNIKLKGELPKFKKFNIDRNPLRIDLSSVTEPGKYEFQVKIPLPYGFELVEKSLDTVSFTIKEKEIIHDEDSNPENNNAKEEKAEA